MRAGVLQILVGIDFSDSSAGAMYHALALAERLNATVHLCHIAPMNAHLVAPTDLGLNVPMDFREAQEVRHRLERIREQLGGKLNVELHVQMGDPVSALLSLARELRPDMMVVGSHGRGAVMRLLLGSVSTQLIRLSPVPVLVVPAPGREALARPPEPPAIEPASPSVGSATAESLDVNRTNDSASGSVNLSPSGVGNYDVNPELRVRY